MATLKKWIGEVEQDKCIDWDFPEARREKTTYLSHGIHSYTSKYIPQIPHFLIKKYSLEQEMVLDNFLGSGTTLIEASLLNRNAIGIDLNQYPCLISDVKTLRVTDKDIKLLKQQIERIQSYIQSYRSQTNHSQNKANYKDLKIDKSISSQHFISRLYSKENLDELLIIKAITDTLKDERIKNVIFLCLLGILRRVSYLSSNFANDYVPRNKDKKSDVLKEFLSEYHDVLNRLVEFSRKASKESVIKILNEDTRELSLKDESVDLIVNHPPYISAVPYAEYFKLEMIWLGLVPKDLNKKIIGGQRGSNNVVERFNEGMEKTFIEMFRVLKKRKYACVVIGNARVKGKTIESNKDFVEIAKKVGFTFIEDICRNKLDCANAWMKTEHILIFKKE